MWTKVWQAVLSFFRSPREPYVASAEPFLKLDVEAIRAQFRPAQQGEDYGRQNLPPSDATSPDSREAEISRFLQEELARAHSQVTRAIDTHLASIRQLSTNSARSEINQLQNAALSELHAVAQNRSNRLAVTLDHAQQVTAAFERFREIHRRDTLPDLARGGAFPIAILIVMVAIETAINGSMFAQGNDFGLVGGMVQAMTFSIANISLGVVTGIFAVRQLYHVNVWRRLVGAAACLVVDLIRFSGQVS